VCEATGGGRDQPIWITAALERAARTGQPPAVVAGDLTLIRPLGWHGVPVVAVTTDLGDPNLRSRFVDGHCLVTGHGPAHEVPLLRQLVTLGERLREALGRPVPLFYGQDSDLELLYRHRRLLERHFLFVINDEPLAWSLHDKSRFATLCEAAGVLVPRTVTPSRRDPPEPAIAELRPPLVVKPSSKSDWKGIQQSFFDGRGKARVFASAAELCAHPAFAALVDQVVVQEYIEAPVTALSSFHGFAAQDGRLLASFCGRKLRTWPPVAGESALCELVIDPDVETAGRTVVERLGIRGPFKIDLLRDPRGGTIYTLEVNARFNLWHHLGAAHGVNLPALAYDYLVHGRAPARPPEYQPRARWLSFYRDYHAFREDDGLSVGRWVASWLLSPTVHETFAWDDPLPFFGWLAGMARGQTQRRWRRWLGTA
jgi:predicted ATP-grasp superfamily ATP-dependent carboligase